MPTCSAHLRFFPFVLLVVCWAISCARSTPSRDTSPQPIETDAHQPTTAPVSPAQDARRPPTTPHFYRARSLEHLRTQVARDASLRWTVRPSLQRAVRNMVARDAPGAEVVILEPHTGDVLALHVSHKAYPTGSVFKPFTALAALKEGALQTDESIVCPGYFLSGTKRWNCSVPQGHGTLDLHQALGASCNVFAFTVASRMRFARLVEIGAMFGLGKPSGLEIVEERGALPTPEELRRQGIDTPEEGIRAASGIVGVWATPGQMARAYAGLATGSLPDVHLVRPRAQPSPKARPLAVSPSDLEAVRRGLRASVQAPYGTGSRAALEEISVAGKTGTIRQPVRDRSARPHAWFVGYAPAENPVVVIAVLVPHSGAGGDFAAPLAQNLLRAAFP